VHAAAYTCMHILFILGMEMCSLVQHKSHVAARLVPIACDRHVTGHTFLGMGFLKQNALQI